MGDLLEWRACSELVRVDHSLFRQRAGVKYRTIVADPPWDIGQRPGWSWREGRPSGETRDLPYATMSVEEIAALPVRDLSFADYFGSNRKHLRQQGLPSKNGSHLFLWATSTTLEAAHEVARAWGFTPSAVLVWCKEPRGFGPGGLFRSNVEFVIYARRGAPPAHGSADSRWYRWPRGVHSAKPEAFLDLVEQVCPGPYLELFARRQRLGWDTWGDEALCHVDLGAA
jgi:N6-adenosine-specific RNA methylase IME4